jgi:N-acetylated-alpha-linked acidic dipeptidase
MRLKMFVLASVVTTTLHAQEEKQFDSYIKPAEISGWMKEMASQPNQVGGLHDKQNAEYELGLLRSWGWDAHIELFHVLYPTPVSETLETTGPNPFRATLTERPVPGDETSSRTQDELPAYVAYQGDGNVTAPLVYVNYGMQDDYLTLQRLGIDVRGKIAIARYGHGWRGLKPKLAQDHGAVGCIIYSDPAQDGYGAEKTYPDGPMRPPQGIQRGSVADMPIYPGDPLTPGVGAVEGAKRINRMDAPVILKIPALPISYGDAVHFLETLQGPVAPPDWRGALPITYHVGASKLPVHLSVTSNWMLKPIYDVIATIKGSEFPDEWIVRGNHHDGWVFGASDPLSGQSALLAEAQAIGAMVQSGYKPKRTIIYASWDAEEPGLIGSTEWVETHADDLKKHAIIYINTDENGRGLLDAGGSPDFAHFVNQIIAGVNDPETNVSVAARLRAAMRVAALSPEASPRDQANAKLAADPGHDLPIAPLGSGSDFSSFLQHLGLPALNIGYGGEGEAGGVYHSAYDTWEHHARFVDPGFAYDALLAKTVGHAVLRLADATLPQQRAGDFAAAVSEYVGEVKKLTETERQAADTQAALLRDHAFTLAADPTKPNAAPERLPAVPYLEFASLDNAAAHLRAAAHAYDAALTHNGATLTPDKAAKLRTLMQTIDQTLAPEVGLPGRPWYKNLIFAPGRYTGYQAKTLPAVREAIEEHRWVDADKYARITAAALEQYSARLEAGREVVESK